VIGTLVLVLVILALGLATVAVALRAGPSRNRRPAGAPLYGGRRAAVVGVGIVTLAFGIGVPALVIAVNHDNQSKQAVGGVELTSFEQDGRKVYARNCATCHTLAAANSVGRVGPNLDQIRPPKALVLNAIQLGRARGQGQMPAGLVDGQDAQAVATFIAATAGH
jgi:mono/diheme cytochrome c family protein